MSKPEYSDHCAIVHYSVLHIDAGTVSVVQLPCPLLVSTMALEDDPRSMSLLGFLLLVMVVKTSSLSSSTNVDFGSSYYDCVPFNESLSLGPLDRVTIRIAKGGSFKDESTMEVPRSVPRLGYFATSQVCDLLQDRAMQDSRYYAWVRSEILIESTPRVIYVVVSSSDFQSCGARVQETLGGGGCSAVAKVTPMVILPFKTRSHHGAVEKVAWPAYLPRDVQRIITLDQDTEFASSSSLALAWQLAFKRFVADWTWMGAAVEPTSFACRFQDRSVQFGFNSGVVAWDLSVLRGQLGSRKQTPRRRLGSLRHSAMPREESPSRKQKEVRQKTLARQNRQPSVGKQPPPRRISKRGPIAGDGRESKDADPAHWWWKEVARGGIDLHSLGDQNVFNFFARLYPDRFAVLPCELNFGEMKLKFLEVNSETAATWEKTLSCTCTNNIDILLRTIFSLI